MRNRWRRWQRRILSSGRLCLAVPSKRCKATVRVRRCRLRCSRGGGSRSGSASRLCCIWRNGERALPPGLGRRRGPHQESVRWRTRSTAQPIVRTRSQRQRWWSAGSSNAASSRVRVLRRRGLCLRLRQSRWRAIRHDATCRRRGRGCRRTPRRSVAELDIGHPQECHTRPSRDAMSSRAKGSL